MVTESPTLTSLDLRGRTITTFIAYQLHETLVGLDIGGRVELVTDAFTAIDADLHAWCRSAGHTMIAAETADDPWRFTIEKGEPPQMSRTYAAVIGDDGLLELLTPLGFALAAALEGHDVSLFFQGPAVRVLRRGYVPRLRGLGRPFSRFPRAGLAAAGHVGPQEKVRQLQRLGARIYACGPSMQHFRVPEDDLAVDDVVVAEYLTFMEQLAAANVQLFC